MKKILYLLLAGLLALAACDGKGDEPDKDDSPRILLNVFTGFHYYIYDSHGKLIYECPDYYAITSMTAEGKDWYGVLQSNTDSIYRVLKNGKPVYSTRLEVECLCVENGDIYTLQRDWKNPSEYTARIFKNDRQLYEYSINDYEIHDLSVDHGDLIARAWHRGEYWNPMYWLNGKFHNLPNYTGLMAVTSIVKQGSDTLAVLQNGYNPDYWWMNGEAHQLPNEFSARYTRPLAMLAGGIPYIVGICNDGLALIINGQKHILDSPHNYTVMKMQRYRNDVYTLTCAKVPSLPTEGSTRIFKGTEPVELDGNITVTDVSFWDRDNIFNLSEISIYDFVVLDK